MPPTVTRAEEVDPFAYRAAPLEDWSTAEEPRYEVALGWMRDMSGRAVSLDLWARGNYARRVIANRRKGVTPLIVPVESVSEMRWAYRRLALLGVPVEFLWQGRLSEPMKVIHLHPSGPDDLFDAGWGYVAALVEPRLKVRRRLWIPVIGFARLMPEEVASWVVDEVPEAFAIGEVFVTPSELVGFSSLTDDLAPAFETLTGAVSFRSRAAAESILSVELPLLDRLKPRQFRRLLADHALELERLRVAFRKLVACSESENLDALVEELNYETSELTLAEGYQSFRSRVTRLGGIMATSAAAVGAVVGAASGSVAAGLLASAGGVAAAGLCECLTQRAEHNLELRRNPLFMLWKLGSEKGGQIQKSTPARHRFQERSVAPIAPGEDGYFHWLPPPRSGMKLLGVKKKDH